MKQTDKCFRVLEMYAMVAQGRPLRKKELAEKFKVTEKSIQRDIETLRAYFLYSGSECELVYDAKLRAYSLKKSALFSSGLKDSVYA